MTKSNQPTYTINGNKLTIDADIHRHYNLNIIQHYSYKINARGEYDLKHPILDPLNWLKSDEGKQHIRKIHPKPNSIIRLFGHYPLNVYTTSFYVWLGYLKHCIGDIDTAINAELVNCNVT